VENAFAEEVEPGAAEHLSFQHFYSVDGAFDRSGVIGQGQSVVNGLLVAAQEVGEGTKWS
jgi:hypothetical protein